MAPPLAGLLLIALFVRLGVWQLDRAGQKVDLQRAFDSPAAHARVSEELSPAPFQPIEAEGRYLPRRQFLIDNVVKNGRLGYYVISPMEIRSSGALLLVNRGWIEKPAADQTLPDISIPAARRTVRGKAGNLPRVGIRPGEAFAEPQAWPRIGVWPNYDEIAAELARDVRHYVLLLDAGQEDGFLRRWQPQQSGPSTHYGYAFQWFAMATAVFALLSWHIVRSRRKRRDK